MNSTMTSTVRFSNFKKASNRLECDISGMNNGVVNGLRRSILMDIQSVGFCHEIEEDEDLSIRILENKSSLQDEIISHRVSMLPLRRDMFEERKVPFDKCVFRLDVSQKDSDIVTTDDFKLFVIENQDTASHVATDDENFVENVIEKTEKEVPNAGEFFVRDEMSGSGSIITRFPRLDTTKTIQTLKLECVPKRGTHSERGAGMSPVSVCSMYKNEENGTHHLLVEGIGMIDVTTLVEEGIESMVLRCREAQKKLQDETWKVDASDANYNGIDVTMENETHTLGNMLNEWMYEKYFNASTKNELNHVSYHLPHPLKKEIIFRVCLKKTENDFEKNKKQVVEMITSNLNELENYLILAKKQWHNTVA